MPPASSVPRPGSSTRTTAGTSASSGRVPGTAGPGSTCAWCARTASSPTSAASSSRWAERYGQPVKIGVAIAAALALAVVAFLGLRSVLDDGGIEEHASGAASAVEGDGAELEQRLEDAGFEA